MQKLWLKNFELEISPNTWSVAQDLVQAGGVRQLQEVERHFWVATVQDGEMLYEVETIITPNKIKAFTCECWAAGRRLMCPHIAAALFKVRQFLEQKAAARQARVEQERQEKSGRLTTENVLESVNQEELAEFVRTYARRDRDFALALKTWFASKMPTADNPFLLVLDAALPRHAGARALLPPEFRRLRHTLDDLALQARHAVEAANIPLVFQIETAVLQRTTPLLLKANAPHREVLLAHCRVAVEHLLHLSPEHLSPELHEQRRDFLFAYLTQPEHPVELERSLLTFLAQAAADDAFFAQVRDLFDRTPFPAPPMVLHLFLAALSARNLPEATVRILRDYEAQPTRIHEAVAMLYHLHYWEATLLAGEYFLGLHPQQAELRRSTEDLLLIAAERASDRTRLAAYLRQRYRQYGHAPILERLQAVVGQDWPAERKRLLAELQAAGDTAKIAPLLAFAGDLDALSEFLKTRRDLRLLHQYEHLFWPDRTAFVRDFYLSELSAHLAEHFGKQASEYVRDQLGGLVRKGQVELAKEVVAALVAQFPDRQTLPGELAAIFPKPRRQPVL